MKLGLKIENIFLFLSHLVCFVYGDVDGALLFHFLNVM